MSERRVNKAFPLYQERSRRVGRVGTVLLAGGVALTGGASVGGGLYFRGDPLFVPKFVGDVITNPDCPTTEEGFVRVSKDNLTKIPKTAESIGIVGYKDFVFSEARKSGLRLIDTSPYIASINESESIDEVMGVLNKFTSNFGIETEIAEGREPIDTFVPFQSVDRDDLSVTTLQDIAQNLIYNFQIVPSEVVSASGAKKIKLINSDRYPDPDNPGKTLRYVDGMHNDITRIIYLDIEAMGTLGNTLLHELVHGIDEEYCRVLGGEKDSQFDSRNPWEFNYGQKTDTDTQPVISEYAAKNAEEDKAETLAAFLMSPHLYPQLEKPVRDKIDLMLARLELKVPGITQFYTAIAKKDF